MEAVFDYRIPVLHPLAVHFPLTLLITAAIASILWTLRGTAFWRHCTAFLLVLSVPGALVAYLTGEPMLEQSEGVPIVEMLAPLHERMALYTLVASIVAAVCVGVYCAVIYRKGGLERDPIGSRTAMALLVVFSAVLVAWTAHIGATMTWGV